jgi:translation initiation factor 4B
MTNSCAAKDRQDGRDFSDWSRKGPLPDLPGGQRRVSERPGFAGRSFDNMSDAGSERGGRRNFEQGDGKVRDFSNWERKGPLSPAPSAAPSLRDGGRQTSRDGPGFRRNSPAWGEGRSQDGSRPPRREYQEKPVVERTPTASELDNQWRTKMRPDRPAKSPTPETSNPPSPAPATAPTTRPRLNLQKRTVSEADPAGSPASTTDSKFSPFGAARPVDTAAKEKEVVEKRQLAIRQKKEADEKAKAEKAEEKRLAREKADLERANATESKEPKDTKEADAESPQPGPKFDILRRADPATNDMLSDDDAEDDAEEKTVADDKAIKPKGVVRDAPASKVNGTWRTGDSASRGKPAAAPPTTTENLEEEDGWSTVSKPVKQRNGRRGNQPARAIAS